MTDKKNMKAVVVTTAHRGVFFGYTEEQHLNEKSIPLTDARNCIYWRGIKGFLALAESGPTNDCRVGPAANITLHDVTCVALCTPNAAKAWEKAPW